MVGGLGERAVNGVAFRECGRPVGGRTNERVPEPHPCTELEQPHLGGRPRSLGRDSELFGGAPYQHRLTDRVGRCQHDQPSGVLREHLETSPEALLDGVGQRHRTRHREAARQLGGRRSARQFEQRQRVAARLGDDPLAHDRVDRPRECRGEQGAGVGAVESLEPELRQARQLTPLGWLADREQECDSLRQQPPRHEPEDLDGGIVKPLEVIHQAEQRLLLGGGGHQAERRETDQEATRWIAARETKRNAEGVGLGLREGVEPVEHRSTQLVQPRVGQLHL